MSRIGDRDLRLFCPEEFSEAVGKAGMSRRLERAEKATGAGIWMVYLVN